MIDHFELSRFQRTYTINTVDRKGRRTNLASFGDAPMQRTMMIESLALAMGRSMVEDIVLVNITEHDIDNMKLAAATAAGGDLVRAMEAQVVA